MVQHPQHIMMLDLSPDNFSLMRPTANAPGEKQMLLVKVANGRKSRPGVLKTAKDLANGGLYLHIRIKNNRIAFGVTQSNGQDQFKCSTPCLVEDTSLQAGSKHKQLGL
jgi:hypothetical protein